jgi:hypothetical protein
MDSFTGVDFIVVVVAVKDIGKPTLTLCSSLFLPQITPFPPSEPPLAAYESLTTKHTALELGGCWLLEHLQL